MIRTGFAPLAGDPGRVLARLASVRYGCGPGRRNREAKDHGCGNL